MCSILKKGNQIVFQKPQLFVMPPPRFVKDPTHVHSSFLFFRSSLQFIGSSQWTMQQRWVNFPDLGLTVVTFNSPNYWVETNSFNLFRQVFNQLGECKITGRAVLQINTEDDDLI